MSQVRRDHPGMNLRDIYFKIRPPGIGRDSFESICKQLGLGVNVRRNPRKTTDSQGVKRFKNLLEGLAIYHKNQVWQSDITYFEMRGRFFYLTFIQDAYTRMIVGHSVSRNLQTEYTTIPALQAALRRNKKENTKGLIFHSDGGGQYYSDTFLKLTRTHAIVNSMGKEAQENGMAERLNGVIKNNYLKYYNIKNFDTLVEKVDRVVKLYNEDKPHRSLNRQTPIQFENQLRKRKDTRLREEP